MYTELGYTLKSHVNDSRLSNYDSILCFRPVLEKNSLENVSEAGSHAISMQWEGTPGYNNLANLRLLRY